MGEEIKEGKFRGTGGISLYYRIWESPAADEIVLLLHGKGEYISRYEETASFFVRRGKTVAGFDYRGHGRSEGRHVHINCFQELLDDVSLFVEFLKGRNYRYSRIILFGHSLGALIAVQWANKCHEPIRLMILSAPCFGIDLSNILIGINDLLNRFAPKFIYQNPIYPPYLSHDRSEVEKYKKDPWIRRKISVRMLHEMLRETEELSRESQIRFDFPVYVLMAGIEKIVDMRKTREIFDRICAPKKELVTFPDMYHEILHEVGRERVYTVLDRILKENA